MVKIFDKYYKDSKREPVIVDYVRTPLGSKKGTLNRLRGDDMAIHCWETLKKRTEDKIDWLALSDAGLTDSICGCNSQIGACALDIGKTVALSAGFPMSMPGVSINRQCASGMQAIVFAAQQLAGGDKEAVILGGVESQNVYPIMADMNVAGAGPGGSNMTVPPNLKMSQNSYAITAQAHWEEYTGMPAPMQGQIFSAELMGRIWKKKSGMSDEAFREALDKSAVQSHDRAGKTFDKRAGEIEPITVPTLNEKGLPDLDKKGRMIEGKTQVTSKDESVRKTDGMLKKLKRLKGIVKRKTGILTAGNSCPTTDGAAAMVMTTRQYAEEHGLKIRGTLESYATVGTDSLLMLTGPIGATPIVMERAGMTLDDMSAIEINEAFSTVVFASCYDLKIPMEDERLNKWGGAMAIGHPTGATGCRLIGTLLHQLEDEQKDYGYGTLCVGLGMGIGAIVKSDIYDITIFCSTFFFSLYLSSTPLLPKTILSPAK